MSRTKILISLSVLLLSALACNYIVPTQQPTAPALTAIVEPTLPAPKNVLQSEAEVPRIPVEQAFAAVQSGAAIIVDVRSTQAYEASHAAGALSIPLATIEAGPNGLPLEKDQWVITYCT